MTRSFIDVLIIKMLWYTYFLWQFFSWL